MKPCSLLYTPCASLLAVVVLTACPVSPSATEGETEATTGVTTMPATTMLPATSDMSTTVAMTTETTGSETSADMTTRTETSAGECEVDRDCDDGLFCDGVETCVDGVCQAAAPIDCGDADVECASMECDGGSCARSAGARWVTR